MNAESTKTALEAALRLYEEAYLNNDVKGLTRNSHDILNGLRQMVESALEHLDD